MGLKVFILPVTQEPFANPALPGFLGACGSRHFCQCRHCLNVNNNFFSTETRNMDSISMSISASMRLKGFGASFYRLVCSIFT